MAEDRELSLREQKDLWQSFTAHEGWKMLAEVIRSQVDNRKGLIFAPLEGHDKVFAQEYLKGEAAFGELILTLPTTMLEQVQVELDQLKQSNSTEGEK